MLLHILLLSLLFISLPLDYYLQSCAQNQGGVHVTPYYTMLCCTGLRALVMRLWGAYSMGGNTVYKGETSSSVPFKAVGELMGCVQSQELDACARLTFPGLSCWEASVTLYLWFRLQTRTSLRSTNVHVKMKFAQD